LSGKARSIIRSRKPRSPRRGTNSDAESQAFFGVVVVQLEVFEGERFDQDLALNVESTPFNQDLDHRPIFGAGPLVESGGQDGLVDRADLNGEHSEKKVLFRVGLDPG
jgi:hypothetical protein